eukprot:tig00000459_g1083.t1
MAVAADAESAPATAPAPFDLIDDHVLTRVLDSAGFAAAWRARAVARRWRAAFDTLDWGEIEFARGAARRKWPPAALDRLAGLVAGGGVRLRDGCALSVWVEPTSGRLETCRALTGLLSAAAGRAALRSVDLTLDFGLPERHFRRFLGAALDALRPSGGRLAALAVRSGAHAQGSTILRAGDLRDALAPFPGLTSLSLSRSCRLDDSATKAIAAALPRLRRLETALWSEAALAGLAPVPLEYLGLHGDALLSLGTGLADLAAGPAARSLRELRLLPDGLLLSQPLPAMHNIDAAGVRALAALPCLERVVGRLSPGYDVTGDDLARLGSAPRLEHLEVRLHSYPEEDFVSGQLRGLARAAASSRTLRTLDVAIGNGRRPQRGVDPAALEALLESARGRLRDLIAACARPLAPREAAALGRCCAAAGGCLRRAALEFEYGENVPAALAALARPEAGPPTTGPASAGVEFSLCLRVEGGEAGLEAARAAAAAAAPPWLQVALEPA